MLRINGKSQLSECKHIRRKRHINRSTRGGNQVIFLLETSAKVFTHNTSDPKLPCTQKLKSRKEKGTRKKKRSREQCSDLEWIIQKVEEDEPYTVELDN